MPFATGILPIPLTDSSCVVSPCRAKMANLGTPDLLLGILEDIFRPTGCNKAAASGHQPGKRRTETQRLLSGLRAISAQRTASRAARVIVDKLRNSRGRAPLRRMSGTEIRSILQRCAAAKLGGDAQKEAAPPRLHVETASASDVLATYTVHLEQALDQYIVSLGVVLHPILTCVEHMDALSAEVHRAFLVGTTRDGHRWALARILLDLRTVANMLAYWAPVEGAVVVAWDGHNALAA